MYQGLRKRSSNKLCFVKLKVILHFIQYSCLWNIFTTSHHKSGATPVLRQGKMRTLSLTDLVIVVDLYSYQWRPSLDVLLPTVDQELPEDQQLVPGGRESLVYHLVNQNSR